MIWFGGYDTSFIRKNFIGYSDFSTKQIHRHVVYLPLTSSYYWQVKLNGVHVTPPKWKSKNSSFMKPEVN